MPQTRPQNRPHTRSLTAPTCLVHAAAVLLLIAAAPLAQDTARPAASAPPPATAVSAGQGPDDAQLAGRLRAIYARVPGLDGVVVQVERGVVRLTGATTREGTAATAIEIAQALDGVVRVDADVQERDGVAARVLPSMDRMLQVLRDGIALLPLLGIALAVFVAFWYVARLIDRWSAPVDRLTQNKLIRGVVRQVVRTAVVLVGLFLALEIIGATALVGAVLGTAGVVGLAVGFAFRGIVENYLASLILSVRQPFQAKDLVEIDGRIGTVVRLTTRETVLMTPDGNHLLLPNAKVFTSNILNFTRNPLRRFDVAVPVARDADLKAVLATGLDVLQRLSGVVTEPEPFARIETLAAGETTVRFHGWVDQRQADHDKVRSEALRLLDAVLRERARPTPTAPAAAPAAAPARPPAKTAAVRAAAAATTAAVHAEAARADVGVEATIEKQVEQERARSREPDLLDQKPAAAPSPPAPLPSPPPQTPAPTQGKP